MNLSTHFADIAAAGWRPVHPCTDVRELTKINSCYVGSGDCMVPILQCGDVLCYDKSARAEHGDIVVFNLSSRAVEAMKDTMPPEILCGPLWVKLLAIPDGSATGFLLANGGDLVTASFMSSEIPTDDPPIWPVRNIRRNGRLLFGSSASPQLTRRGVILGAVGAPLALAACRAGDVEVPELPPVESVAADTAQLGLNAATAVLATTFSGPANVYSSVGNVPTLLASISVGAYFTPSSQVVTVTGMVDLIAPSSQFDGDIVILTAPAATVSGSADTVIARNGDTTTPRISTTFAIEKTFSVPANTAQTYYIYGFGGGGGVIPGATINITNVAAKAEVILR